MRSATSNLLERYPIRYREGVRSSELIRRCRASSGLTLRELAARAGTSHPTVAAYEAGRKEPAGSTLERLVLAAGFELELRPSGTDPDALAGRGVELEQVLDLAEQFPRRHAPVLDAPIFGRR